MKFVFYIILLSEIFLRYFMSSSRNIKRLHVLIVSVAIQSLMIFPIIFSPFIEIKEKGLDEFKTPYGTEIGIMFPTLMAFLILITSKSEFKVKLRDIKYPLLAIIFFFIYSYIIPYNYSFKSTTLALLLFSQILFTILILNSYLSPNQFFQAIYDAFGIIIVIEFIISFTYILGIDGIQGYFISNIDEAEWIREGSSFRRAYGTTMHPNRLGCLCTFIYFLFFSSCMHKYKIKRSFLLAILSFLVVIFSQSRSALLTLLVSSSILMLIRLNKEGRLSGKKLFQIVFAGAVLIIGLLNISIVNDMIFNSDIEDQGGNRLAHYIAGWIILNDTSFIGVGLNAHVHYMYYHMNIEGLVGDWMTVHAIHSVHLTILVEIGILGLIAWLHYLFSRIKRYIKIPFLQMRNEIIWSTFIGILLAVFIHGFTDPVYFQYQFLIMLCMLGVFSKKRKYQLIGNNYRN